MGGRGKGSERSCYLAVVTDESSIKIGEPKEALELLAGFRLRPISDCGELVGIHLNLVMRNDVAEERYRGDVELTLLRFYKESVLVESFQNQADMMGVFLHSAGVDKDVVEVDENEPVKHVTKNVIHEVLEDCMGIGESEGHD